MPDRAAPSDRALAAAPDSSLKATGCIVLADGRVFYGRGFGAARSAVAELCFNTAMTGYQEIMTDPSYAGQVVTFTFPHIGNVGVNVQDDESAEPAAAGHGGEVGPHGARELARGRPSRRVARAARPDRRGRDRHAPAHPRDPSPGRAPRGDLPRARRRLRPRRPAGARPRLPGLVGMDSRAT
jgi:hypothetical protein